MTMPHWYLVVVGWFVLACGFVGSICATVGLSWWCVERALTCFHLHDCFLDFMSKWIRDRHERAEAAALHKGGV